MNWLQRKWNWAGSNPFAWLNLLLAILVIIVVFAAPSPIGSEIRIRWLGMALQLLGAWTVWRDLTSTARHFGKPSVVDSTLAWLKAGFLKRNIVLVAGSASFTAVVGRARAKQRRPIRPELAVDERLANLEELTRQIDETVDSAFNEIDTRVAEVEGKVKSEAQARAAEIGEVKKSLESTATGNFSKLAFGAFWLVIGIILSTASQEIAKGVNGQASDVWRALVA